MFISELPSRWCRDGEILSGMAIWVRVKLGLEVHGNKGDGKSVDLSSLSREARQSMKLHHLPSTPSIPPPHPSGSAYRPMKLRLPPSPHLPPLPLRLPLPSPPHEAHAMRVHKEPILLVFVPIEHGGTRNGMVPALADTLQGSQLRGKDGGQCEVLRSGERGEEHGGQCEVEGR